MLGPCVRRGPSLAAVQSIEDFCQGMPIAAFEAGETLLAEGHATGKLYALISGTVEITKSDYQINIVSDRGAIFGEMAVLLGFPHMATVRALTRCEAYEIPDAEAFLQTHKESATRSRSCWRTACTA
jgi:CRP/FNR family cyclic AMP-dependent transcriptional regulator